MIDLTIEQMYNNFQRGRDGKTSGILRHRPLELASLGVEAAARLSGPRPEDVVSHKLAALPRLCTRASRQVHHLLFFCTRTALCSGCRSHQGDVCRPSTRQISPTIIVDTIADRSIRQPRSDRSSCRRRRDSPRVRRPASLSRHSAPRRAPSGWLGVSRPSCSSERLPFDQCPPLYARASPRASPSGRISREPQSVAIIGNQM